MSASISEQRPPGRRRERSRTLRPARGASIERKAIDGPPLRPSG
jgi:hypothetical protein